VTNRLKRAPDAVRQRHRHQAFVHDAIHRAGGVLSNVQVRAIDSSPLSA